MTDYSAWKAIAPAKSFILPFLSLVESSPELTRVCGQVRLCEKGVHDGGALPLRGAAKHQTMSCPGWGEPTATGWVFQKEDLRVTRCGFKQAAAGLRSLFVGFETLSSSGLADVRASGRLPNKPLELLLPHCRFLLAQMAQAPPVLSPSEAAVLQCPPCQGPMQTVQRLTALEIRLAEIRQVYLVDTSRPASHDPFCMCLPTKRPELCLGLTKVLLSRVKNSADRSI